MTDKEQNKNTSAANNDISSKSAKTTAETDSSKPSISAAQANKIAAQAKKNTDSAKFESVKPAKTQSANHKPRSGKTSPAASTQTSQSKQSISKIGSLALIISLLAIGGGAAHYYLQQQENQNLEHRLTLSSQQKSSTFEKQLKQQFSEQLSKELRSAEQRYKQQINQLTSTLNQQNELKLAQLQQALTDVIAQKPMKSEITEAEYLVRMAGRVLWLEKNVDSAIALMQDADQRLTKVNDPRLLSIRQLLHQDIEKLKLLPQIHTDEIILSFMGLSKQIGNLPLASLQLPETTNAPVDTELTNDINDWRENLAKTWHSFKEEFITVRRRTGQVEALMEPQFQRNLYHNLELKIQQIQWAASQKSGQLYVKSITELQHWIGQHFDMSVEHSKQFVKRLEELKTQPVNIDYPSALSSQQALQALIESSKQVSMPLPSTKSTDEISNEDKSAADDTAESTGEKLESNKENTL